MKEIPYVAMAGLGGQFQGSIFGMILDAGLMVKFVLLLLLGFSVVSWAIIWWKYRTLSRVKKENDQFLDAYVKSTRLADIFSEAKKFPESTLAEVFRSGYGELIKITKTVRERVAVRDPGPHDEPVFEIKGIDNIERSLNRASGSETDKLEKALGFLATTGSACPFIGLFGTVWGIMDTFKGIGARGSATLAVVAPGISEALIATAAGLAAAIPAVIFFNYYTNRIKSLAMEMDAFATELVNIIERNYLR
ncbi:MAG TPA: protein TolQ [Syntrophales bacterium]|nr:protein TolQ [Syntrophales bacterium]HON22793.1 protein TolQ [Syntrophales bacterium]HOU76786.1 protein TolQ [Syntrophales bacterium]HPC31909.1 protein TolQ [Syntrophales bacterium]HQG33571.1 protein TolQ [Syntrophales bacterium]